MKNLLIALCLLAVFCLAAAGLQRLLVRRGQVAFAPITSDQLVGRWQSEKLQLSVQDEHGSLRVSGLPDLDNRLFTATGKAPRWTENSPDSKVPMVLEWNGKALELRITDDANRVEVVVLQRTP